MNLLDEKRGRPNNGVWVIFVVALIFLLPTTIYAGSVLYPTEESFFEDVGQKDDSRIKVMLRGQVPISTNFSYAKFIEAICDTVGYLDDSAYTSTKPPMVDIIDITENENNHPTYDRPRRLLYEMGSGFSSSENSKANKLGQYVLDPFVKGALGSVTFHARGQLILGERQGNSKDSSKAVGFDAKRWAVEVGYGLGQSNLGLGYARANKGGGRSGEAVANSDVGGWLPLLILPGVSVRDGLVNTTGSDNLENIGDGVANGDQSSPLSAALRDDSKGDDFLDVLYAYGSYSPLDNVTLCATIGFAGGDEVSVSNTNANDKLGAEVDVGAKIKIGGSVTYDVTVGFLGVGDFWKLGSSSALTDDAWSVMNSVKLTF